MLLNQWPRHMEFMWEIAYQFKLFFSLLMSTIHKSLHIRAPHPFIPFEEPMHKQKVFSIYSFNLCHSLGLIKNMISFLENLIIRVLCT